MKSNNVIHVKASKHIPTERVVLGQFGYLSIEDLNLIELKHKLVDTKLGVNLGGLGLKFFPVHFGDINGDFDCSSNRLVTLFSGPKNVKIDFYIKNNCLTSLEHGPETVGEDYICSNNKLITLKGSPKQIFGDFDCSSNLLTSLKEGPNDIAEDFNCSSNDLRTLNGGPSFVRGTYNCSENELTSLEGSPEWVNSISFCTNCISSLKGISDIIIHIGSYIDLSHNPIKEGGIGLLLIEGLQEIICYHTGEFEQAAKIISKYLKLGYDGILDCQEELIDAGLERFAKL